MHKGEGDSPASMSGSLPIIGHRRQVAYFSSLAQKGNIAHGYLFSGPAHVGKRTIAIAWARSFMCEKFFSRFGGCGECRYCLASEVNHSPRLRVFSASAAEEAERKTFGIDEVREIRRLASFASSGRTVFILDEAELLTEEASHALLKMLEEPLENISFILVTSSAEAMLPTIISRLVPIRFARVSASEMVLAFPSAGEKLLALAHGAPGIVIRALRDAEFKKREEELYLAAERLRQGTVSDALAASAAYAKRDYERSRILAHLLSFAQHAVEKPAEKRARMANSLARALDILDLAARPAINQRLATDILFMHLRVI